MTIKILGHLVGHETISSLLFFGGDFIFGIAISVVGSAFTKNEAAFGDCTACERINTPVLRVDQLISLTTMNAQILQVNQRPVEFIAKLAVLTLKSPY